MSTGIASQKSWSTMDKSGWGDGPWLQEPDKVQWIDPTTSLDCLVVRNQMGALCGYVGVPPGHPWHGLGYGDVTAEVHGGLTFAGACQEDAQEGHGICHVPEPGRPADVWWMGFDCNHHMDRAPAYVALTGLSALGDGYYRDLAYVQGECASLATQAAAA